MQGGEEEGEEREKEEEASEAATAVVVKHKDGACDRCRASSSLGPIHLVGMIIMEKENTRREMTLLLIEFVLLRRKATDG